MSELIAPLATIAIPTFNRAALLPRAVASAQAQDYPALEIIVVDNASDDGTEAFCREVEEHDARVRYVRQPINVGPIRNFEAGLANATGHYFMWLADDDWISADYVRRCVMELERKSHVMVVGRDYWHFDDRVVPEPEVSALDPDPFRRMLDYLRVVSSNAAVYGISQTSVLRVQLPFPRQIGGDWQWVLRLLRHGTLGVVHDVELNRRAGGASGDFRVVAELLGSGRLARHFPLVAMPLGMVVGIVRDKNIWSVEPARRRVVFAAHAGIICWLRMGASGQLVGPLRLRLQRLIPRTPYAMLRMVYRPARRAQSAIRLRFLGR